MNIDYADVLKLVFEIADMGEEDGEHRIQAPISWTHLEARLSPESWALLKLISAAVDEAQSLMGDEYRYTAGLQDIVDDAYAEGCAGSDWLMVQMCFEWRSSGWLEDIVRRYQPSL